MSPSHVRSLVNSEVVALAAVAQRTSTLTGSAIDMGAYEGTAKVILHGVRATGTLTPKLQDSPDGSTDWTDVPTALYEGGFAAITAGTDFLQEVDLDVQAARRYVRFVGTAASTPDHTYSVTACAVKKYE